MVSAVAGADSRRQDAARGSASTLVFMSLMFKWLKSLTSIGREMPPHVERQHRSKARLDEALASAQRISRPCIFLRKEGSQLAAVWGGRGTVPGPSSDEYRHWISIDTSYLPSELALPVGVMSVFAGGDDWDTGVVSYQAGLSLDLTSGDPLYAHHHVSLPPPDALAELNNPEYIEAWQKNCPIYNEGATAVIGGWHFPWPDGDWDELCQHKLVVWTIESSEPWVEVWNDGKVFRVCERVT